MQPEVKPNILLVDDDAASLYLLEIVLKKLDVNLILAQSGLEALSKIEGREIAIALLDIQMPGMDGVELAELLQNDKSKGKIPIIFITANTKDELELEKCYESGAVDFILKPFPKNILLNKVKIFLELYRQKQQIHDDYLALEKLTNELVWLNQILKESNEFNDALLQSIPFGMDIVDEEGYIIFQSDLLRKHFVEETIGKKYWELYCDDKSQWLDYPLKSDIKIGETLFYEAHGIMGGKIFKISHTCMLFQGKEAILKIFQDITELKIADEKIRHQKVLLTQVEKVSHTGSWHYMVNTGQIFWSDELYEIFGLDKIVPEEDMFDVLVRAIHPDDKKRVEKILSEMLNDNISRTMDFRIIRADGSVRWVQMKWKPQYDEHGRIIAQFGFLQDLTEQKKNENALRESEKMYRTLLNASPEGIIIMDLNGRITEISNIILEIFSAGDKNEFIGVPFFHFIPSAEVKKMKDILSNIQSEGLIQNIEFILTRKNQSQFICELSITLIQEADGKPDAYMAIIRDISQRKKIEQQLNRSERMVSLGEMASGMAHEINQPLLSITLGIENLFMKIQQAKVVDEVYFHKKSEKIFEDVLRIGRIIDHVRAFSRDHDEYIFTSFDINDSINNAISMISEQFKHHGIRMIIQLDKNVHPIIGNTYTFEQVILNLLTNAKDTLEETIKTSKSGFEKTIVIRTYHDDHTNFIEVKDNGKGIKPDVIDRIMLPFYTTKEAGKGTGLGLSISFGIIKELKGSIDVESDPIFGTTFEITLPVAEIKE